MEVEGVEADLAVRDVALVVLVDVLQRVFDGDDVARAGAVDVVDHRREGRRLARAGGSGDENESQALLTKLLQDGRQVQLVQRPDLERDDAHDRGGGAALTVDVHADAALALQFEREVHFPGLREDRLLTLGHHVRHQLLDRRPSDHRHVLAAGHHRAVQAHHGNLSGLDVHVGHDFVVADLDEVTEIEFFESHGGFVEG